MTRQEAIERMEMLRQQYEGALLTIEAIDMAIESLSADRPSGEWKPVCEGLPQRVGSYLVTCTGEYGSVYVDYDFWTVLDEFKYNRDKVTAWMPFPRPYCGAKMGTEGRK